MDLTNIHKSFLLLFALCSFASFVFLFQFNITNGVLTEVEYTINGQLQLVKFGLNFVVTTSDDQGAVSYDKFCESTVTNKMCSSREKMADLTTAATYVTLIFCISLFSEFFLVLEKNELSLISKVIGFVMICLYVADVALHGVLFSENDSFYSAAKKKFFISKGSIESWNQGQSMVYIGGSLICNLAIPGAILIYGIVYFIYSYCYKKNDGYSGVSTMSRVFK